MRSLTLGTLLAVSIAFGLTLGTTPQPAAAQTAKKLKCNGCVKSKQLKNGGIKGIDIKDGTVGNADLAFDAVTGGNVQNNSLTGSDIQDGSVGSFDITDESLTDFDLAPDSVGTSEVQNNSLTAQDLGTNSVGTDEVQPDAVNSSKVANGSIAAIDLASPTGSDSKETGGIVSLLGATGIVVESIQVNVPGPGYLIVNAGTSCLFDSAAARCSCAISAVATLDGNQFGAQGDTGGIGSAASTRGFIVNTAGTATISLVCAEAGEARVQDRNMTAIYTPTRN